VGPKMTAPRTSEGVSSSSDKAASWWSLGQLFVLREEVTTAVGRQRAAPCALASPRFTCYLLII
jgi:hypothetical protein